MWSIDACLYSYHLYSFGFSMRSLFLFSFFSFLSFLSFYLSFLSFLLPFTVHRYPFFRLSAMVGFTIFAYQLFWLLMGVLLGLSTNLPATQPLPLLKVCWLHHSPFSDKITCLVSYLSLFFTSHIQIRIKPLHYLPLQHASGGFSLYLPLLSEMPSQQDISPKEA